ncbi:MAG: peptide chain release factor N(5)-glutamine methyltransferase [Panacagrimonas sp.]
MNWAAQALDGASDSPRADAEELLAALLGCERSQLVQRADDALEAATVLRYASWTERRRMGEPVAYIAGRKGFWTLDLAVNAAVLVPRPDTECLVEWACDIARSMRAGREDPVAILDLGTGSGAIALALADSLRDGADITATDRSQPALALARENARALGLEAVRFAAGHWFEALRDKAPLVFDLIVSNPPYIRADDPHLAELRHEPRMALVAGADGLDALREIIANAPAHLAARGWLLVEHGHDQGEAVRALFRTQAFADVQTRRDFGGNERVTGGMRR